MKTVEVVIKIPKKNLDEIKTIWNSMFGSTMLNETDIAILSGTILPQGHGDLKDVQDIINKINLNYNNHQSIDAYSLKDMIATVPTIIKADKAESEE